MSQSEKNLQSLLSRYSWAALEPDEQGNARVNARMLFDLRSGHYPAVFYINEKRTVPGSVQTSLLGLTFSYRDEHDKVRKIFYHYDDEDLDRVSFSMDFKVLKQNLLPDDEVKYPKIR